MSTALYQENSYIFTAQALYNELSATSQLTGLTTLDSTLCSFAQHSCTLARASLNAFSCILQIVIGVPPSPLTTPNPSSGFSGPGRNVKGTNHVNGAGDGG